MPDASTRRTSGSGGGSGKVAPSKTDRERLLVVSPELSEALAAIIARVRGDVCEALEKVVRSMRPGGQLVIGMPDRALTLRARLQPRFRAYRVARRLGVSPTHLHRRSLSGISMLTIPRTEAIAGFDRVGVETVDTVVHAAATYRQVRYVGLVR